MANEKTPLILIHGFRGNALGLKQLADEFNPKKYDIYLPELPPFGKSAKTLPAYTSENYADFIAKYIKDHHLSKPILIGHSMGSIVAAATAAKYPEILNEKIVFLAPISSRPSRLIANLQPLVAILPNKVIGYLSTEYMIIDRTDKKQILKTTYESGKYFGNKKHLRSTAKFSSENCIADFDFKKNALFIAGEKDRLVSKNTTKQVAAKYHAKTNFLPNTGHLLNYEKPHETAKAISDFIEH